MTIREGDDESILCGQRNTALLHVTLIWQDPRGMDAHVANFNFQGIVREQAGDYICVATGSTGQASATLQVVVECELSSC